VAEIIFRDGDDDIQRSVSTSADTSTLNDEQKTADRPSARAPACMWTDRRPPLSVLAAGLAESVGRSVVNAPRGRRTPAVQLCGP